MLEMVMLSVPPHYKGEVFLESLGEMHPVKAGGG